MYQSFISIEHTRDIYIHIFYITHALLRHTLKIHAHHFMEIGSSIYHTQFTPQTCTPTHIFTVNSYIATIIQEMEWCDVCRGHYVQWALVSQLEPNARRSRELQDYADVVTQHVCTNRICSQGGTNATILAEKIILGTLDFPILGS
jgi:hypothetical protein